MMIRRVPVLDKAIGLGQPYTSSGFPATPFDCCLVLRYPQQTSVEIIP
jgi:hypothetical protein